MPIPLNFEAGVFEVEVSFDAASGFFAQAALVPELEQRGPLRAEQFAPETLVVLRASLVVFVFVLGLAFEEGEETAAAVLVEVAHPPGCILAHPALVFQLIDLFERRLRRSQACFYLLALFVAFLSRKAQTADDEWQGQSLRHQGE
jgi:CRP-like cAMP-binding protein